MIKIKASLCLVLVLVLTVLLLPAAAADGRVTTEVLLDKYGQMVPVPQTHYILVQSTQTKLWGVFDTDGRQLMEYCMRSPEHAGSGCFTDTQVGGAEPNNKAVAALNAGVISDFVYGAVRVYNYKWAAGWVLEPAGEEEFDYAPNRKTHYNITACDLFWLGDSPCKVASLTREEFASAAAHEDYLSVADREGNVAVYDRAFNRTDVRVSGINDAVYGVVDYALIDKADGRMILDGVSSAKETPLADGICFQVTRTDLSGTKWNGICDFNGEWLLPLNAEYTVKSVTAGYALMAREDRLGLYSLTERRWIVPCEYDSFLTNKTATDPYSIGGMICGIIGNQRHYIDAGTGETVNIIEYTEDSPVLTNGAMYYTRPTRVSYQITSAAGRQWNVYYQQMRSTRGDGRLIIMQDTKNNRFGIYTMNGDVVLPFNEYLKPAVTDDGRVIRGNAMTGYQLIRVKIDGK